MDILGKKLEMIGYKKIYSLRLRKNSELLYHGNEMIVLHDGKITDKASLMGEPKNYSNNNFSHGRGYSGQIVYSGDTPYIFYQNKENEDTYFDNEDTYFDNVMSYKNPAELLKKLSKCKCVKDKNIENICDKAIFMGFCFGLSSYIFGIGDTICCEFKIDIDDGVMELRDTDFYLIVYKDEIRMIFRTRNGDRYIACENGCKFLLNGNREIRLIKDGIFMVNVQDKEVIYDLKTDKIITDEEEVSKRSKIQKGEDTFWI